MPIETDDIITAVKLLKKIKETHDLNLVDNVLNILDQQYYLHIMISSSRINNWVVLATNNDPEILLKVKESLIESGIKFDQIVISNHCEYPIYEEK